MGGANGVSGPWLWLVSAGPGFEYTERVIIHKTGAGLAGEPDRVKAREGWGSRRLGRRGPERVLGA